jgi:hypothetical protein
MGDGDGSFVVVGTGVSVTHNLVVSWDAAVALLAAAVVCGWYCAGLAVSQGV